ncbi:MAG: diapolycopene oxygenase [Flavobacteriales bacterium]|jgi:diapolycopene oxygenase
MKIAVIGSGIGGLAAACRLANKGYDVTVFEKNALAGGKIGEMHMNGYRFDTGPSLFTLPQLVEELYTDLGEELPETFTYQKIEVLCKYFFDSDQTLVAYSDQEKFLKECKTVLDENPENITKYLSNAALMYRLTADIFIFNSLNKLKNLMKFSVLKSLLQVNKLRVYKTMHNENVRNFKNPQTIQIFDRYATYNGSNPYKAPATLNVIAHLENNIGAFFPDQGMYSIVRNVFELAQRKGVKFEFNTLVSEVLVEKKKAVGIKCNNQDLSFDKVVVNSDVNYLVRNMMKKHPLKKRLGKLEPSSSAMVFYWGVKKMSPELDVHNILFSANYEEEFKQLFDEKNISEDPTVYIFISSKIVKSDSPEGCENWFVMINAPSDANQNWGELVKRARKNIVNKINSRLKINIEDYIEHEKIASPRTIQEDTLSQGGALYGNSSNSMFAAFLRHPNFLNSVQNIYFAGGSVHPGGGIPLCLASAKIVDLEIPAL